MPTLDEVATVGEVVTRARATGIEVLVVDDASGDGTREVVAALADADAGVHLLERPGKLGLGSAYRTGFSWGLQRGYDVLIEMDADLSHDPDDLPRLVAALDRGAGLAIGSRYVPGGKVVDWPWQRVLLSRGGNLYVRLLTGLPVQDATAGFRAYRREVLESLDLSRIRADGYAFQVEMALRTWLDGHRITEVPITFTERREGASKMSRAIVTEALWRVLLWAPAARRHAWRRPR